MRSAAFKRAASGAALLSSLAAVDRAEAARAPVDAVEAAETEATPTPPKRALALGASVVPGTVVHGAGHYVIGERDTAARLLIAEAVGLGMFLSGGTVIVLSGASRYLVGPAAALTALGFGVFATGLIADIYGVARAGGDAYVSSGVVPLLESSLGYRYVYDPQFEYRNFMVESLELRVGRLRLAPSAWLSLDHPNARYRGLVAWRLSGPLPELGRPAPDGTFLDAVAAATEHRYELDGFSLSTAELTLEGRYDLARLGRTLRGSFVDGQVGYARQITRYDLPATDVPADNRSLLLARFGFGVYLGSGASSGGEAHLYYDHRHDDFAAGLKLPGLGSGVAGHFGADARWYFDEHWGVLVDAQVGSAVVLGASVLFRQWGVR